MSTSKSTRFSLRHLPLSRHGEVEGVEAPGDLELSADTGHAVKLGVVSVPEGRDLDLIRG